MRKVYRYPLNTATSSKQFSLTTVYQCTSIMQRLCNMYYRSMVWIATKLTEDIDLPQEKCNPVSLFEQMIQFNHLSWGHCLFSLLVEFALSTQWTVYFSLFKEHVSLVPLFIYLSGNTVGIVSWLQKHPHCTQTLWNLVP